MKLKAIISRDLIHEDRNVKISEILKAYMQHSTFRLRVWLRIAQYTKSSGGVLYPLVYKIFCHYKKISRDRYTSIDPNWRGARVSTRRFGFSEC